MTGRSPHQAGRPMPRGVAGHLSAQSQLRRRAMFGPAFVDRDHGDLMSLLHRDRRVSAANMPSNVLAGGPLWWRSAMAGVSAAVVSMLTIALPALLVWVASAESLSLIHIS